MTPSESIQQSHKPSTCYRHPDRVTYVCCTRCNRPLCPECMYEASVGYQCKQCMQGSISTRKSDSSFLRRFFPAQSLKNIPFITYGFIALNVVIFLLESTLNANQLTLWPVAVATGQSYRLITAAFLHYGVIHLLFNMWALYVVGPPLESYLGKLWFTVLYILCGLGGSVTVYLLAPINTATAGASGIIFGLFGATFIVARRLKVEAGGIITVIVINLGFTFTIPNVSWQGHVGGLITGLIVMAFYLYPPEHYRRIVRITSSLVILALFSGLILWRTTELAALLSFS